MKNFIAILVMLCVAASSFAQGVYLGPRIGANFANVSYDGDDDPDLNSRTSVLYGGVLELGLADKFAIQPEVSYIVRGYEGGEGLAALDPDITLNYLDFGGLLKFKTGSEGLNAYLGAGPYYSYALSGEIDTGAGTVEIDFDDEEAFERGDWTAAFAAGVQLPLGESFLFVDARYLLGLTDLNDRDEEVEVRNRAFSLSAGILFAL
ncbi:MAG: outer membrane beta-barrel protein [Bacteroidetes bacterium]|jgi:hypothetical protein|nr:outer membrane beta-barrel protein [Bacteroidota bacterium]